MKFFSKSIIFSLILFGSLSYAQDSIVEIEDPEEEPKTFVSTRVINGHSVETLAKGYLDMRIEHRFGDMFGTNGGYQNMFGFDNLSDMRFALEYGITDDLMIGFGRSKGTNAPFRSLLDGFVKYRVLRQKKGEMPLSISLVSSAFFTYMKASSDESQVNHFPKATHRLSYFSQINIARHFGERFSLALMPTYVHRNYVAANDMNDIFALGGAMRLKLTRRFAIIGEYYHVFHANDLRPTTDYKNSLGIALEWFTFGHNFTINLTNSGGLGEAQFIPNTYESWSKGQFRFGFCVGRKFSF